MEKKRTDSSKYVQARMSKEEYNRISREASHMGLSVSAYASTKILQEAIPEEIRNKLHEEYIQKKEELFRHYDLTIDSVCRKYYEDRISKMSTLDFIAAKNELKREAASEYKIPLFEPLLKEIDKYTIHIDYIED
ncbi:MAG: hypothetical protein AB9921_02495 [Erysipelotrichaceae bacterium]